MNKISFETISAEEKVFLINSRIKKIESHKKKLLKEVIDCDDTLSSLREALNELEDVSSDIDIERIVRKQKQKRARESKKYSYVTIRLFESIKNHFMDIKDEGMTLTYFLREAVKKYLQDNSEYDLSNHVAKYEEFYETWRNEYPMKNMQVGILKENYTELMNLAESLHMSANHLLESIFYNKYENV